MHSGQQRHGLGGLIRINGPVLLLLKQDYEAEDYMPGALNGIRVLDFSMGVAGPHAGLLCAQHGADVIKIEGIEGDWGRLLGRQYGDLNAYSAIYNRGKRSLSIDLKDPEARSVVVSMASRADIIIEAFRPGVMQRFGLDFETLRERNPGLIYVSVTGFGQTGPMSQMPATDGVMQAFSGFMYLNQDKRGEPQRVNMILIDAVTGLYAFQAITTSLLERMGGSRTGKHIDCSLMKSAISFQACKIVENLFEGGAQAMYVPLGAFHTRDGCLAISVMHDHHFVSLCQALGKEDWGSNPLYDTRIKRIERETEVVDMVRTAFLQFTTAELSERLTQAGVLHSLVLKYPEMLQHPQVRHIEAVTWVQQDGIGQPLPFPSIPGVSQNDLPASIQAPHIGQHSAEILQEWEADRPTIDGMINRGVVRIWDHNTTEKKA